MAFLDFAPFADGYGRGFELWFGLNRVNSTQDWQWDRFGADQKV